MFKKLAMAISLIASCLLSLTTNAAQIILDDVIVQGSQCTGMDCDDGEVFNADLLRLKENNTRIRFHDTSAANLLGQSWNINANRPANGGRELFDIGVKSLPENSILLSDGSYDSYPCPTFTAEINAPIPTTGKVPVGEPVQKPVQTGYDASTTTVLIVYTCEDVLVFTEKSVIGFGIPDADFITIGIDSAVVDNAVSVGQPGLERKLVNVAAGLAETSVLITQTINEFSLTTDQSDQVTQVSQQLDLIDSQLDSLEGLIVNLESAESLTDGSGSINGLFLIIAFLTTWRLRKCLNPGRCCS